MESENGYLPYGKQYIDEKDLEAVNKVLRSDFLTTGPKVGEFEAKLCQLTGAPYAVAVANGTAALHAACHAAGIQQGDEVITTPITFAASANCILYCGGTPVFADINPTTWNIDPSEIEKKITAKTKAVIAVDFTGQVVEIHKIRDICKKYGLFFIEDAAHSIGSKYNGIPVGNLADMTTFSFHPVKTITSGEGGAVMTNDRDLYKKMHDFRSHSITRDEKDIKVMSYPGYGEQIALGYNYRLSDIHAALGLSQLEKLMLFSKRRKEIVGMYNNAFKDTRELIIQQEIPESETTRHLYVIRLNRKVFNAERSLVMTELGKLKVGTQVHYMPVYYHPYYEKLGYRKGLCPHAEALYEDILTIPLYFSMTDKDVEYVISSVKRVLKDLGTKK